MYQILKIKAGNHYCDDRIPRLHFFKTKFIWDVQLSSMNKYPYEAGAARSEQINKLFGFSNSLIRHRDEFRFGWRCNKEDKIDLFCYYYINGVRPSLPSIEISNYLTTVDFDKPFRLELDKKEDAVYFTVKDMETDTQTTLPVTYTRCSKIGWLLKPYNGGRKTYKTDFFFTYNEIF